MRKVAWLILLFLALGGAILWQLQKNNRPITSAQTVSANSALKQACDVFSLSDAQNVLGNGSKKGAVSTTDSISTARSITSCSYTYDPGSLSDLVLATILLRGSSSAEAKKSFNEARGDSAITVSGYGESAYWNPIMGQLNILKGQYYIVISAGSGPLDGRSQDLPRKIADIVITKL